MRAVERAGVLPSAAGIRIHRDVPSDIPIIYRVCQRPAALDKTSPFSATSTCHHPACYRFHQHTLLHPQAGMGAVADPTCATTLLHCALDGDIPAGCAVKR